MGIISRLLCSMFNSCIVTRGMIIGRFIELLFCAIVIVTFGFIITSGENLPLIPVYIVGFGCLFVIIVCTCAVITFAFMALMTYIFTIIIDIYKAYKKYMPKIPLRINFDFDKFLNHTVSTCKRK